jgi:eukaryotic-like serine/threonine-protein kinase
MIGETIGRFELRSRLGAGGFGEVWLAGHRETGDAVAIKLLDPRLAGLREIERFVEDSRAVGRIANANTAKVFDAGIRADGRPYVVSELVLGETLAQRIARGRASQTQVADVIQQIARSLIAAQGVGVVHHALKPSNVMLVPDPERASGERAVVLDHGLAALVANNIERTAGEYLAPEQWMAGERAVDGSADAYALGCIAFEMATARPPFKAASHAKLREKHLRDAAPSIRSLMPDVGVVLDKLVARMLEKQPADRPRSMKDIAKLFDLLVGMEAPLGETVRD